MHWTVLKSNLNLAWITTLSSAVNYTEIERIFWQTLLSCYLVVFPFIYYGWCSGCFCCCYSRCCCCCVTVALAVVVVVDSVVEGFRKLVHFASDPYWRLEMIVYGNAQSLWSKQVLYSVLLRWYTIHWLTYILLIRFILNSLSVPMSNLKKIGYDLGQEIFQQWAESKRPDLFPDLTEIGTTSRSSEVRKCG